MLGLFLMAIYQKKKKKKNWEKVCKKAKISRKILRKNLDKLFSIIIRSKGKCERCGEMKNLNIAHIFSRRNLALRWNKDNVLCLCVRCHFWSHQNPILFAEFVKKNLGKEKYEELKRESEQIKKWTIPELEDLLEKFNKKVKFIYENRCNGKRKIGVRK